MRSKSEIQALCEKTPLWELLPPPQPGERPLVTSTYVKRRCLYHKPDNHASMVVYRGRLLCNSCGVKKSTIDYLRETRHLSFTQACDLLENGTLPSVQTLPTAQVLTPVVPEAKHYKWAYAEVMHAESEKRGHWQWFEARGFNKAARHMFRFGWHDYSEKYSIPIWSKGDDGRTLHAVKLRRDDENPYQAGHEKYAFAGRLNEKKYLYLADNLVSNEIVLCGGEFDAAHMTLLGFPAVSSTTGENGLHPSLDRLFLGKTVYILLDADVPGRLATAFLCDRLERQGIRCYPVELPPDGGKDVNDYVLRGWSYADFQALMAQAARSAYSPEFDSLLTTVRLGWFDTTKELHQIAQRSLPHYDNHYRDSTPVSNHMGRSLRASSLPPPSTGSGAGEP